MSLTDSDFNNFASELTHRFSQRSKGLDSDSKRILAARPSDQILAGFLTPTRPEQSSSLGGSGQTNDVGSDIDPEEVLADDLPRDSAYEQTSLGLEWLVEREQMLPGAEIEVELHLSVYVRRFPTFEEQSERKIWERTPFDQKDQASATAAIRQSKFVSVWTREDLPPILKRIDLSELRTRRRLAVDASPEIAERWGNISKDVLFPGRQALRITEPESAVRTTFEAKVSQLQTTRIPVGWKPVLDARLIAAPTEPGCARIALRVINQTERIKDQFLDFVDPNLYAVQVRVSVPKQSHRMSVFRELPDSYRYNREMFGVGINSHVNGCTRTADIVLETESIPIKTVDRLEPREIDDATPSFESLAKDPIPILATILNDMKRYSQEEWETKLASLTGVERQEAVGVRESFIKEINRFERGITLLAHTEYGNVRRAFSLMNEAIQDSARGAYGVWRLFQIVFIVSLLPALAAREHSELSQDDDDDVDVLWFAAGGGKTEAFLGLILWQAFFDRLRGKQFGVTAYVRFPLRLLAFQQLRRLGRALASAEVIRKREKLGGARFSMGDFVGSNVTPNRIYDAEHNRFKKNGVDRRFQRIFQCPFCDSEVRLDYEEDLRLIKHVCTKTSCLEGANRLPIYVVDYDIYRFLPTVIVSTVDKIALLGYNQRFANIFGRFDLMCYRHGASFKGTNKSECEAAKILGEGSVPQSCQEANIVLGTFHDAAPALLIQDELHLLSEEVGAFDATMKLVSWSSLEA